MASIRRRRTRKNKIVFDVEIRRARFAAFYRTFKRITDAKIWIKDVESELRRISDLNNFRHNY